MNDRGIGQAPHERRLASLTRYLKYLKLGVKQSEEESHQAK
jgi:hypothetical protein